MTTRERGRATGLAPLPSHWRGRLPDPSVERLLPIAPVEGSGDEGKARFATVPLSLLYSIYPDLGVLVWSQLRMWFDGYSGETTYVALARELGQDDCAQTTLEHKFSNAVKPLLGTWIRRTRIAPNVYAYQAVLQDTTERYAMIRTDDVKLLRITQQSARRVKPADLVDFARWQLECRLRGWTAEPVDLVAARWGVTQATVRRSRQRLERLGLLKSVRRQGPGRLSDIVWLAEVYDPNAELIDAMPSRRIAPPSSFRSRRALDRKTVGDARPVLPAAQGDCHLNPLTLSDLRHRRAVQRHEAIAVLTSPRRSVRRPVDRWKAHEVYLIHFPAEGCFKVGLSRSGTARIEDFVRHGGIVVDRILVSSRPFAELIEADILQSVEGWHRLGDRLRAGGGYTEMWSDDGPTVDLPVAARQAADLVERIEAELAVGGPA